MRKGKLRDYWDMTSSLMSLYISAHSKNKILSPEELNPFRKAKPKGIKRKMDMGDYLRMLAEETKKGK